MALRGQYVVVVVVKTTRRSSQATLFTEEASMAPLELCNCTLPADSWQWHFWGSEVVVDAKANVKWTPKPHVD